MRSTRGLTLIEVLIAIFIMGVAVLAVMALQNSAFKATSKARIAKAAAAITRDRIERIRARPDAIDNLCKSGEEVNGFTMNCTKTPCALENNGGITDIACGSGENNDLYKVEITLTRKSTGDSFSVTTYVKGE